MVGHSPDFQILLQTAVRMSIMASPPAWTNSSGMLSTPADFPVFSTFTAASTSSHSLYSLWLLLAHLSFSSGLFFGHTDQGSGVTQGFLLWCFLQPLLWGLNRFYGIPTLTLGPDVAHTLSNDLRPNFPLSGILYHDNINKFVE